MIGEILQFLTPSLSNPLEVFFFSIIAFGLLLSLITSQVFGQPAKWEKNWRGGARINALDIEHGSIGELSHAVASGWERFASNMPGLLLIIGLLGTFLGLGLALDKASTILQGHDDSLNAMSGSLTQLTGMMKDLGTKFKTSTWGIIAFILIKLWEAAPWSAESKRTDWCLEHMKAEIDLSRKAELARHAERDEMHLAALESVGTRLVGAFNAQGLLVTTELKQIKAVEFKNGKQAESHFNAVDTRLADHQQQLGEIARFSENLAQIAEMSTQFSRLVNVEESLKGLQAVETRLGEVANSTRTSSECLQGYVEAKTDNLQRQEAAVQLMGESATLLADSAGLLKGSVQVMQEKLSGAIESLNEDFAGHLVEMKASMDGNITRLGTVMETIEGSLTGTITTMSREFTQNTQDMAANLKGATDNISTAVDSLSEHIGTVVKQVQGTIVDAKDMQKKTSSQFSQTSATLNEAIATMSSNMDELGKSISEGLKEASKAGHKMDAVASKLVTFPQLADQFTALNVQFKTMTDQSAKTQESLEALPARLVPLGASVKLLEELCKSARQLPLVVRDVKALADAHRQGHQAISALPEQMVANIDKQFANRLQVLSDAAQSTVVLLGRLTTDYDLVPASGLQTNKAQPA